MKTRLLRIEIRYEQDVVLCRQRARQIAALLGFSPQTQVRIATAVSEIARNAYCYAGGGKLDFCIATAPNPTLQMSLIDQGPGFSNLQTILDGKYISRTGMGLGILGTKKLMDHFQIETTSKGTTVVFGKLISERPQKFDPAFFAHLSLELSRQTSKEPFVEVQQQNQELLAAFNELEQRRSELAEVNLELETAKEQLKLQNEQLENRVAERTAELKGSLHQMDRFCYSIAHDLRAPLRAINGWTMILRDDFLSPSDEPAQQCASRIMDASNRMDLLIADLLEYGRLTHVEVINSPLNLNQEIEKTLKALEEEILARKATIEIQNDLPTVLANAVLLQQTLHNLIENGLKFVGAGVAPRLKIWAEHGSQKSKAGALLATTRLWIRDNGIGIATSCEQKVFKVFERLHGADSAYPGTGIGLALVQKAVERMDGIVGVQSDSGKGSIFWIELPSADAQVVSE
jgi:signal transduction histidine kinase/anti-sigma regulatory factor (Ser/Thr protein kinase)